MKEVNYLRLLRGPKFHSIVISYALQESEHEPDLTAITNLR